MRRANATCTHPDPAMQCQARNLALSGVPRLAMLSGVTRAGAPSPRYAILRRWSAAGIAFRILEAPMPWHWGCSSNRRGAQLGDAADTPGLAAHDEPR
jgi:hypothetical protein